MQSLTLACTSDRKWRGYGSRPPEVMMNMMATMIIDGYVKHIMITIIGIV